MLDVTESSVSNYLAGNLPKTEVLCKISHLLGVSVDWLLWGKKASDTLDFVSTEALVEKQDDPEYHEGMDRMAVDMPHTHLTIPAHTPDGKTTPVEVHTHDLLALVLKLVEGQQEHIAHTKSLQESLEARESKSAKSGYRSWNV